MPSSRMPRHCAAKQPSTPTLWLATNDETEDPGITAKSNNGKDERVLVGSAEYYQGFVSRDMREEPVERVTGDAVLTPILKFAASSAVLITAFLLAFLKTNDII